MLTNFDEKKEHKTVTINETKSRDAAIFDPTVFKQLQAIGHIMASGTCTVPAHLRGKPEDCMAIASQAYRWGLDPFVVAQKTHLVKGTFGYEAQLVNAVLNSSGLLQGRLRFEYEGDWKKIQGAVAENTSKEGGTYYAAAWTRQDAEGLYVKVIGRIKGEDFDREHIVYLSGIVTRNSTLWGHNPQQQLTYQGVKEWARKHAPDAILGVYTIDELQDEVTLQTVEDITPVAPKQEKQETEKLYELVDNFGQIQELSALAGKEFLLKQIDEADTAAMIIGLIESNENELKAASLHEDILAYSEEAINKKFLPVFQAEMFKASMNGKSALKEKGTELKKSLPDLADRLKANGSWDDMAKNARMADDAKKKSAEPANSDDDMFPGDYL